MQEKQVKLQAKKTAGVSENHTQNYGYTGATKNGRTSREKNVEATLQKWAKCLQDQQFPKQFFSIALKAIFSILQ